MKNRIFDLQIFRGKVSYNEAGKPTSENQPMTLEHNTIQFDQFLKNAKLIGITKIIVEGVNGQPLDANDTEVVAIAKQLEACVSEPAKQMTPEERIKQLEKMVEALTGSGSASETKEPVKIEGQKSDLELARDEYFQAFGKKPHHLKSAESLRAEIAEKQNA